MEDIIGFLDGLAIFVVIWCVVVGGAVWLQERKFKRERREWRDNFLTWMDDLRDSKTWEDRGNLLNNSPSGKKHGPDRHWDNTPIGRP